VYAQQQITAGLPKQNISAVSNSYGHEEILQVVKSLVSKTQTGLVLLNMRHTVTQVFSQIISRNIFEKQHSFDAGMVRVPVFWMYQPGKNAKYEVMAHMVYESGSGYILQISHLLRELVALC
jgi:hypothetical protein